MPDFQTGPRRRGAPRRAFTAGLTAAGLVAALSACGGGGSSASPPSPPPPSPPPPPPPVRTRSWRMGFSPNPPRPTVQAVLQGVDLWSQRAELAIIHEELPWADLLAGASPDAILTRDKVALVNYLRGKGLALTFMLDLTNGLARESESTALTAAGRSLTEPSVQALARDYALAVHQRLAPAWLGVAAETNLIRAAAAPALYQAVRTTANDIDAALGAINATARRFVSVQVETAWGRLGAAGSYVGVEQDFADFAFTQALGLSSYPYFGFADPDDLPLDYYTRLRNGRGLPVIVTEGGWISAGAPSLPSSPDRQARYIARHGDLLDSVSAEAYFQLQFADIDLASVPPPVPSNLPLFASIGLTDANFAPKPALAAWDGLFARVIR